VTRLDDDAVVLDDGVRHPLLTRPEVLAENISDPSDRGMAVRVLRREEDVRNESER
jgi:hypothetical protein